MFNSDCFQENALKATRKYKTTSTFTPNIPGEYTSDLEQQLTALEREYVKMETEYSKKVKELKISLLQKTRKQATLTNEITALREEFKLHQEEIQKVSEQVIQQQSIEIEPKYGKKSSSPGLIKKSLQLEKKHEKKMSPNTHITTNNILSQNMLTTPKAATNASPAARRPGTKALSPGFLTLLKNQIPKENSQKHILLNQNNDTKKTIDKSSGQKKKPYSPTVNHIIIGLTSIKNTKPNSSQAVKASSPPTVKANSPPAVKASSPPAVKASSPPGVKASSPPAAKAHNPVTVPTNPSPRRIVRRSPGEKLQVKKEGKKMLGKLKETMEEQVF